MRLSTIVLAATVAASGCNKPDTATDVTLNEQRETSHGTTDGHGHNQLHEHGQAHDPGAHASHAAEPAKLNIHAVGKPTAGSPATLHLTILGADGQPIKRFNEAHEAKVHLIVVRSGLDQFAHLHPQVDEQSGTLTIEHTFPVGGTYHLFAEFQTTSGKPSVATGELAIAGAAPPVQELQPTAPGKVAGDELSADVALDGIKAGSEGTIRFDLSTPEGKPANDLQPYMGAMGHLVVIKADASRYVHSHPTGQDTQKSQVTFAAEFPEAGIYKAWGQFKRNDQVHVVPFVLSVE